jgi:hypothetical protein
MTTLETLVAMLVDAILHPELLNGRINDFQKLVWNTQDITKEDEIWEILDDLAIDLAYYVPNAKHRSEDPSYYGEGKAKDEIRAALKKLRDRGITVPVEVL